MSTLGPYVIKRWLILSSLERKNYLHPIFYKCVWQTPEKYSRFGPSQSSHVFYKDVWDIFCNPNKPIHDRHYSTIVSLVLYDNVLLDH